MKHIFLCAIVLMMVFSALSCSSSNVDSHGHIIRNQTGTLRWGGSPAADGTGMLFIVDDTEYGAPGIPDDYPFIFEEDTYEAIEVRADYKLTGEKTSRGWGVTYPAIEFIKVEKL